jgi:hypothetical protein
MHKTILIVAEFSPFLAYHMICGVSSSLFHILSAIFVSTNVSLEKQELLGGRVEDFALANLSSCVSVGGGGVWAWR